MFLQGLLSEFFLSGRLCPGGFCPFPLLSEYIRYNRKLSIIFNYSFHMYDNKIKRVMSHALDPPLSQTVIPFLSPLERDLLYGRPPTSMYM